MSTEQILQALILEREKLNRAIEALAEPVTGRQIRAQSPADVSSEGQAPERRAKASAIAEDEGILGQEAEDVSTAEVKLGLWCAS